jgi:bifunctional non-homologous end joining protein LigD
VAAKRQASIPAFRAPQLATLVDAVPAGSDWVHEIKYDGYRLLLAIGAGKARAYTRSGLDWADKFPAIAGAVAKLKIKSALIDGEAVVLDEKGRSRFQLIQGSFKAKSAALVFYAFDLLEADGEDLSRLPLLERKKRLKRVIGSRPTGTIRFSEHFDDGAALFKLLCKQEGEGIVAKRASAPYVGARTESWLKIKCLKRQEFVIVGWTDSDKNRGFRSLILAVNERGKLRYAGKVGTGFDMAEIEQLRKRMKPLARTAAPIDAPRAATKGAHWIESRLIAEIAFTEMTTDGVLRHPSYLGLREDKAASDVVIERAKHVKRATKTVSRARKHK